MNYGSGRTFGVSRSAGADVTGGATDVVWRLQRNRFSLSTIVVHTSGSAVVKPSPRFQRRRAARLSEAGGVTGNTCTYALMRSSGQIRDQL